MCCGAWGADLLLVRTPDRPTDGQADHPFGQPSYQLQDLACKMPRPYCHPFGTNRENWNVPFRGREKRDWAKFPMPKLGQEKVSKGDPTHLSPKIHMEK